MPPENKIVRWIKQNKLVAALVGGGGVLLFLTQQGQGESDDLSIQDDEGQLADDVGTVVQLVPVAGATSEGTFEDEGLGNIVEQFTDAQQANTEAIDELGAQIEDLSFRDPDRTEPTSDPGGSSTSPNRPEGITIHGKFFAGATGKQITRQDSDRRGRYTQYLITFAGRTERWRYYSNGKWDKVNASNEGATNPGNKPDKPAPRLERVEKRLDKARRAARKDEPGAKARLAKAKKARQEIMQGRK